MKTNISFAVIFACLCLMLAFMLPLCPGEVSECIRQVRMC